MEFINNKHEKRFEELIQKANIGSSDIERYSLFYLIAGNEDLYNQVDKIYDFEEKQLQDRNGDEEGNLYFPYVDLYGGSKRILNLAIQLYNDTNNQKVSDTFSGLDMNNFLLCINAVTYRFQGF